LANLLLLSNSVLKFKNSECFDTDVESVYDFEKSVEQYSSVGGTAKVAVQQQINHFKLKYTRI